MPAFQSFKKPLTTLTNGLFLTLAITAIVGCQPAPLDNVTTLLSAAGTLDSSDGIIYGDDSRQTVKMQNPQVQEWSRSVVALVANHRLQGNTRRLQDAYYLCNNEQFLNESVLSFCTGTLISPKHVLTAGHCIPDEKSCASTAFVFDYKQSVREARELPTYRCKKLIASRNQRGQVDYAIIELDQPVKNRTPIKIASSTKSLTEGLSLSHPWGLPLKIDKGPVEPYSNHFLKAQVDTFEGSSGSPLLNPQTGELVGILSRGSADIDEDELYYARKENKCVNINRCEGSQCYGEIFMGAEALKSEISKLSLE